MILINENDDLGINKKIYYFNIFLMFVEIVYYVLRNMNNIIIEIPNWCMS